MFFTHWCPGWARKHNSDALLLTPYTASLNSKSSPEKLHCDQKNMLRDLLIEPTEVLSFSSQNDRTSRTNYQQHYKCRDRRQGPHMQTRTCWQVTVTMATHARNRGKTLTHLRQSAPSLTDTGLPLHACVQRRQQISVHAHAHQHGTKETMLFNAAHPPAQRLTRKVRLFWSIRGVLSWCHFRKHYSLSPSLSDTAVK